MYTQPTPYRTRINTYHAVEGETIEMKIERLLNNNSEEKLEESPIIYTRPEDGVIGAFNMRHDWMDEAIEQTEIINQKTREMEGEQYNRRKKILEEKKLEEKIMKEEAQQKIKAMKTEQTQGGQE